MSHLNNEGLQIAGDDRHLDDMRDSIRETANVLREPNKLLATVDPDAHEGIAHDMRRDRSYIAF